MKPISREFTSTSVVSTRDHIIKTASKVFSVQGFNRTSIDVVAIESGVSKMTIFYYFKNKEELILAAIQEAHAFNMTTARRRAEALAKDPKSYISTLFKVIEEMVAEGIFNMSYIRACAEFTEDNCPVRALLQSHVDQLENRLNALGGEAGYRNPEEVTGQLMLILHGLYSTNLCPGSSTQIGVASRMAECVVSVSPAFAA